MLIVKLNKIQRKKMLKESGLNITPADDLTDAAKKIVAAVRGGK